MFFLQQSIPIFFNNQRDSLLMWLGVGYLYSIKWAISHICKKFWKWFKVGSLWPPHLPAVAQTCRLHCALRNSFFQCEIKSTVIEVTFLIAWAVACLFELSLERSGNLCLRWDSSGAWLASVTEMKEEAENSGRSVPQKSVQVKLLCETKSEKFLYIRHTFGWGILDIWLDLQTDSAAESDLQSSVYSSQ